MIGHAALAQEPVAFRRALRTNAYLRVQLSAGLVRGLRIDATQAFRELERAQWLSVVDGPSPAGTAADLRDAALPRTPSSDDESLWATR